MIDKTEQPTECHATPLERAEQLGAEQKDMSVQLKEQAESEAHSTEEAKLPEKGQAEPDVTPPAQMGANDEPEDAVDYRALAQRLQAELSHLQASQAAAERRAQLAHLLTLRGANAAAMPLLLEVSTEGEMTVEAQAEALYQRYPGLFATVEMLPTEAVNPPTGGAPTWSREMLNNMHPQEINDNWSQIKTYLMRGV